MGMSYQQDCKFFKRDLNNSDFWVRDLEVTLEIIKPKFP